jgi:hypothetical protein
LVSVVAEELLVELVAAVLGVLDGVVEEGHDDDFGVIDMGLRDENLCDGQRVSEERAAVVAQLPFVSFAGQMVRVLDEVDARWCDVFPELAQEFGLPGQPGVDGADGHDRPRFGWAHGMREREEQWRPGADVIN